jgi:hypothetical protein
MERINAGNYDYLIMSEFSEDSRESEVGEFWRPIYFWVRDDPALEQVIAEPTIVPQPDYVFKVNGKVSAESCPSKAEEEKYFEEVDEAELEGEKEEAEAREEEHEERAEEAEAEEAEAESVDGVE